MKASCLDVALFVVTPVIMAGSGSPTGKATFYRVPPPKGCRLRVLCSPIGVVRTTRALLAPWLSPELTMLKKPLSTVSS